MILVTGATGNAGGAVVRALLGTGERVRGLVRREADRSRLPAGVEAVTGDLNEPGTLRAPLQGRAGGVPAERLPRHPRRAGRDEESRRRSGRAALQRPAPDGDLSNAIARYHIVSEHAVRESGVPFTFIQPNAFMSNTFRWIPQLREGDVIRAPFARVQAAMIDPDDVGAVAALALTSTGHEGRAYRLSGPESLLPADCVAVLADVLGRELRLEAQTDADARAEMSATMPPEYVEAFFRFYADGDLDESNVLATVRDLTGRRPRRFEQWAIAHADRFRAAGPAHTSPQSEGAMMTENTPTTKPTLVAEPVRSARHRVDGDGWTGFVLGAALVAMALVAGLIYTFSVAVMPNLADADDRTFVATMQRFNENPVFQLSFTGALVLTALAAVLLRRHGPGVAVRWTVAALVLYGIVVAVTFGLHIPLNDDIDGARPRPHRRRRRCPQRCRRPVGGREHRAHPVLHRGGRRPRPGPVPARTQHSRPEGRSERRGAIMSAVRDHVPGRLVPVRRPSPRGRSVR